MTLTWHELTFPNDFAHDDVLRFVRTLAMRPRHGLFQQAEPVVCEVVSTRRSLQWSLGTSTRETGTLLPQLRVHLPKVRLRRLEKRALSRPERAVELRLNTKRRSLRVNTSDTLTASLLAALNDVHGDEVLVLSWLIGPWLPRPVVKARSTAKPARGLDRFLVADELDSEDARALRVKLGEPLLGVVGRVGVTAATPARRKQLVQRVLGALHLSRDPGVGFVTRLVSNRGAARRLINLSRPLIAWPCPLNAEELATVLGWPIGNPSLHGVAYAGGRQLAAVPAAIVNEAAAETSPNRYRVLGRSTYASQNGLLHLPVRDALHHLHVIGPTGSGKSVLLARLIEADLATGRSVAVIEPKADLIEAVLDRVPANRFDDVVLLDPTDRDAVVGMNALRSRHGDTDLAVDQLLHVLHELYRDSWGPRTSQVLHAALLTLAQSGDQTICELPLLLTNAMYRQSLVRKSSDPLGVGPFWSWFESISDAERTTVIGPSLNKLTAFTGRRAIRAVIGQANPAFDLSQLFTQRRVLLVNLAKGSIGPEAARLLGALLFSALWQTALGRSAVLPERRHPVMIYIDEFQDYVRGLPLDFGELLAQARGLGIGLTLAHQGLYQLDSATKASVLTNARSRVVFQTDSNAEANVLANALGSGLGADDLQTLGAHEAYARVVRKGIPLPAASIVTLPPTPGAGTSEAVRKRSRDRWARPVAEIDQELLERRNAVQPNGDGLGGRRRRPS